MSCAFTKTSAGVTSNRLEPTNLFLPFDHPLEERLKSVLEVLDTLLLEARHLRFHEARDVVELLFRVERAPLRFRDDGERAAKLVWPKTALCAVRLVRLLRAPEVRIGVLPCVIYTNARAERELRGLV